MIMWYRPENNQHINLSLVQGGRLPNDEPHIGCKQQDGNQPQNSLYTEISSPHFISFLIGFAELVFYFPILSWWAFAYFFNIAIDCFSLLLQLSLYVIGGGIGLVGDPQHVPHSLVLIGNLGIQVCHLCLWGSATISHRIFSLYLVVNYRCWYLFAKIRYVNGNQKLKYCLFMRIIRLFIVWTLAGTPSCWSVLGHPLLRNLSNLLSIWAYNNNF